MKFIMKTRKGDRYEVKLAYYQDTNPLGKIFWVSSWFVWDKDSQRFVDKDGVTIEGVTPRRPNATIQHTVDSDVDDAVITLNRISRDYEAALSDYVYTN